MNTNDRDIPTMNDASIDLRERFKDYYVMIECELNASEITGANRQVLIKELKDCKGTYNFGLLAQVAMRIKCAEMDIRLNIIERSLLQIEQEVYDILLNTKMSIPENIASIVSDLKEDLK